MRIGCLPPAPSFGTPRDPCREGIMKHNAMFEREGSVHKW
jgi:hypothetical protein